MQLRNLQIPAGAVFAPMAGLTDAACRHLMADHGAAWTVSEMASAKALNFNDQKSFALLKDAHPHGLYAIQLFGCEPEALEKAILLVREKGIRFDILDINMGCPAPKITNSGAGSKLLLAPPLCGRMVAAARRALGDIYRRRLAGLEGLRLLQTDPQDFVVPHIVCVRVLDGRKDELKAALTAAGIPVGVHYKPNHLLSLFRPAPGSLPLPVTEQLYGELVPLPMHPGLSAADVEHICDVITATLA